MKEMKGRTILFSETGTEGGWWAIQEDGFLEDDGVHWKYEGLRYLEEGDELTVYGDGDSVLWSGTVHKDTETNAIPRQIVRDGKIVNDPTWKQQAVDGMWVHWLQAGVEPELWSDLFVGYKRCLLRRKW